jgi:cytochrome c
VRPDFEGLPPGRGSVARGAEVWEAKCASCHGTFGESNEVFAPIVGGTTAQDIQVGLASGLLKDGGRTTLMKVPTLSTLWDYINRAMPWTAPRSLTVEEVYASLAYILNLGGIVPDDFVLSNDNIASVQEKLPNRDGMTRRHGLWTVDGTPDVRASACMSDCRRDLPAIRSRLPEHARDAHGDLSSQQRALGPTRGAVTVAGQPPPADFEQTRRLARAIGAPTAVATPAGTDPVRSAGCSACHAPDGQAVGPSWRQIVDRHRDKPDPVGYLAGKIAAGGKGVWGSVPMPPQPALSDAERRAIATWIVAGAR